MVSCGFLSGKQGNNIGLAVVRKNRIAGRYFQHSSGICEVDYCLLARATTPSPLSLVDEASGSKYYSACPMPVLIYGLLSSYQTAPVHRIPSSTPELLLFCMTHEVFLLLLFSLLQREVALAFDSLSLSSLSQRHCHGFFRISQRPLTILYLISTVKTFLLPMHRSVLSASLCLYLQVSAPDVREGTVKK